MIISRLEKIVKFTCNVDVAPGCHCNGTGLDTDHTVVDEAHVVVV